MTKEKFISLMAVFSLIGTLYVVYMGYKLHNLNKELKKSQQEYIIKAKIVYDKVSVHDKCTTNKTRLNKSFKDKDYIQITKDINALNLCNGYSVMTDYQNVIKRLIKDAEMIDPRNVTPEIVNYLDKQLELTEQSKVQIAQMIKPNKKEDKMKSEYNGARLEECYDHEKKAYVDNGKVIDENDTVEIDNIYGRVIYKSKLNSVMDEDTKDSLYDVTDNAEEDSDVYKAASKLLDDEKATYQDYYNFTQKYPEEL